MIYDQSVDDKMTENLYRAISVVETLQECEAFFEDICTINEIKSLAQRLEVARMLKKQHTYHEIVEKTHASTATISRVNRALQYGANGYNTIIDKLEAREQVNE